MLKSSIIVALLATVVQASDFLCVKRDCGAVPKTSLKVELQDTFTNAKALETCIQMANKDGAPKRVVVPKGYAFSAMPTSHANLKDVTLQIDGVWEASTFYESWPVNNQTADSSSNGKNDYLNFLSFTNCTNLTIKGEGVVDGLGYDWWVREWQHKNKNTRPHLLAYLQVQTSEITGVKWLNSPRFNMHLQDIDSVYIHDLEIRTDVLRQKAWISEEHKVQNFEQRFNDFVYNFMLHFFHEYVDVVDFFFSGKTEWDSWPTMPLNTDGIDPSGSNVTIRNVKITNWDDAVAVKPSDNRAVVAKDNCSQDISVENMTVVFGVGASIGSVSPHLGHSCVRRIHFKDVDFSYPMKAIYIKTNPGVTGTGEIKDVSYENIHIHNPIWFAVYIGPQQQEEPNGGGPGCMTYPLESCETQPLIDVRNITLKNVSSEGGLLPPGLVRCNASNPCQDINFDGVHLDGWWRDMNWTFISEYAHGSVKNSFPDPLLGSASDRVFNLYSLENVLSFVDEALGFYHVQETNILGWETLFGIVLWAIGMAFNGGHFADSPATQELAWDLAGDPYMLYI